MSAYPSTPSRQHQEQHMPRPGKQTLPSCKGKQAVSLDSGGRIRWREEISKEFFGGIAFRDRDGLVKTYISQSIAILTFALHVLPLD